MWANLFYTNPDWIETLIRITLGVVFFAHGAQKLLGWFGGAGVKDTMRTMHQFLGRRCRWPSWQLRLNSLAAPAL
jgi:putative oxidoreductase